MEAVEGLMVRPEYSMSKTLTSASPAQVMSVLSSECGMNFTENIFAECPVETVVERTKGEADDSGWYVWMLRCWSSEPEARKRPDRDQLMRRGQSCARSAVINRF